MSKRSLEMVSKIDETLGRPDPRHAPTNPHVFNLDRSQQIANMAKTYGGKALNFNHDMISTLNQEQMPPTTSPSVVHVQFPGASMTKVRSFIDVLKAQGYSVAGSADSGAYHLLISGKGGMRECADDAVIPVSPGPTGGQLRVSEIKALEERAASRGMSRTAQALRLAASQAGLEGALK